MSHHEAYKIQNFFSPFMTLLLAVACIGLLASCGGGLSPTLSEEINISGDIQFKIEKLDSNAFGKIKNGTNIDDISGFITNQIWATSATKTTDEMVAEFSKFSKLKVIAKREPSMVLLEIDENDSQAISQLEAMKKFDWIYSTFHQSFRGVNANERIFFKTTNDNNELYDDLGSNWHIEYAKIDKAWEMTTGDSNLAIAVYDNGIYLDHEDFFEASIFDASYGSKKREHGTGVVGTISAKANNNIGTAGKRSPISFSVIHR